MDEIWSNLDYTIFDSEKTPNTNTQQNPEQVNNNKDNIKVETDPKSVVIDLVTNNNNVKNLKSSAESGDERTRSLSWSENIVIKTEQKANDFDNCLERINSRNSLILSTSTTKSCGIENTESLIPSIRTNSQGNSNINNQFRRPSASASGLTSGFVSSTSSSSNNRFINMDITDGINEFSQNDLLNGSTEDSDSQLYTELFGDWLHFRPKTPDEDFENHLYRDFGENNPQFAETTSLSVEIQRLGGKERLLTDAALLPGPSDNIYLANPFSFEDVADEKPSTVATGQDSSSSVEILNLSGDSLPELSLSLGENEENDKMLENLLEECQFDDHDLKAFNPSTNFWNGLLDDSGGLLDVIEDKKQPTVDKVGYTSEFSVTGSGSHYDDKSRGHKRKMAQRQPRIGSSAFNVCNFNQGDEFFKKIDGSEAPVPTTTIDDSTASTAPDLAIKKELEVADGADNVNATYEIKTEPMDESVPTSSSENHAVAIKPHTLPVIKTEVVNNMPMMTNTVLHRPVTIQQNAPIQSHQTGDGTLLFSTNPRQIRRFATNGPTENKTGNAFNFFYRKKRKRKKK